MPDITYTAKGRFNLNRHVNLAVCIPAEPSPGLYITELFNLSKITDEGVINALFCNFSNHSEIPIEWSNFDYRMSFDINTLKVHPGAVAFDENKADALFLFFHNNKFEESDREFYFQNIESIYNDVKQNGNQSQDGISIHANLTSPRKIGMSLVTKSSS